MEGRETRLGGGFFGGTALDQQFDDLFEVNEK